MKIYTRTGDAGSTGLFGGPRVSKDDHRIEAYGTVDELNAVLGTVRSLGPGEKVDAQICQIQHELFSLGAELATTDPDAHQTRLIGDGHVARLESWIDEHEQSLTPLKNFILPAGAAAATQLHVARAVCRRAERRVVTLGRISEEVSSQSVVYLNRLSDLLFVMTRVIQKESGVEDVAWVRPQLEQEGDVGDNH